MQGYDASHHDPPAPIAHVTLRNPKNGVTATDRVLLLDTGADVTLLPRGAVEQIGVQPEAESEYKLMAFDGSTSTASVAIVDMVFLNRIYRGKYLLIDEDEGVLGRDVLNHLSLLLDGPRQQWSQSM
jgi:hypothetical protein